MNITQIDMEHYCIFEIEKGAANYKLIEDFGNDYSEAYGMCQSMNNFRTIGMSCFYLVRCLLQEKFNNIEDYSPIFSRIYFHIP